MKITQAILDSLTAQAKASPRLRMNLDLRNSPEDAQCYRTRFTAANTQAS